MAELVGDAYIRITADTATMQRSLTRAMKQGGKAGAKEYVDSFGGEVDRIADQRLAGARRSFAQALVDPKEFDRLAKSFDSIESATAHWRKELLRLSRQQQVSKEEYKEFKESILAWDKAARTARDTTIRLRAEQELATAAIWRESLARRDATKRFREASLFQEHHIKGMQRQVHFSHGLNHVLDQVSVGMGKAFGKGSRNNFLNFVGSLVGGITSIVASLGKLAIGGIEKLINLFAGGGGGGGLASAGKAAAGGMEAAATAAPQLAKAFAGPQGIITAVIGAVVALVTFTEIIPGIISLVGLLGGAISALAGSITFGITGALLAFIPVAAGAVAALGGVAGAFIEFFTNKANKKFVDDFIQPFKDFGDKFQKPVKSFLTTIKSGFSTLFTDITPSVNRFFDSWKARMTDKSTTKALGQWSDSLGRIAFSLSGGFTSLLSGLTGFFVPILPYAEKLANALERAFWTFDRWANSSEGRNSISIFMAKAWHSAVLVWDILKEIGAIIFSVFEGGQDTGDSFLSGILGKLKEIRTFLQSDEGKTKMREWFGKVEETGRQIGEIADAIGRVIVAFNSPEGQANAKKILDAIVGIANTAAALAGVASSISKITHAIFGSESQPRAPQIETETPQEKRNRLSKTLTQYQVKVDVDDKLYKEKMQAIEHFQLTGKGITIKGNEELWNATKFTVGSYVFAEKQIPIAGNTKLWDEVKGTVSGYVFQPKEVPIVVNDDAVQDWVAAWNRKSIATKTARINVSTSSTGGHNYGGGVPKDAAGGFYNAPVVRMIGEAGPEAVVPLDRNLSRVDPAVRQMSAVLQGMTGGRGGTGTVGGPRVMFADGAIQVHLPTGDPQLAAEAVLDRLVKYIG